MIGQIDLLEQVDDLIDADIFPRFSIIVGRRGSGKKLLAKHISQSLGYVSVFLEDVKVDTVRKMIDMANKVSTPTVYIIPDADNMSNIAKNTLLKVTEEPPNNAYFIMTLQDTLHTLPTILSRGRQFLMQNYTPQEINDYWISKYGIAGEVVTEIVVDICETPLEVEILHDYGVVEFFGYVNTVIDNISKVTGANAFKISKKIAIKDEPDKIDLQLFWKAFIKVCFEHTQGHPQLTYLYIQAINVTSKALQELRVTGLSKEMLFDVWILDIRNVWQIED